MLKLILKNFKCYTNKTLEIPLNSLTLINGNSGVGKTTILQAIYWCLYGNLKKITTYNEKSTSVELHYKHLIINRHKNPNTLIVKTNNVEYHDAEGQVLINNVFGTQFLLTSYITQKGIHSFLTLSNNDKMEKLQELAFVNIQQITAMKDKLNDNKKNIKEQIIDLNGQLKMLKETLLNVNEVSKPGCFKPKQNNKFYKINIQKINNKIIKYNNKILKYKNLQNINTNNIKLLNDYKNIIQNNVDEINNLLNTQIPITYNNEFTKDFYLSCQKQKVNNNSINNININLLNDNIQNIQNICNYIKNNNILIELNKKYETLLENYNKNINNENITKNNLINELQNNLNNMEYISPNDLQSLQLQINDNKNYNKNINELNKLTKKQNELNEKINNLRQSDLLNTQTNTEKNTETDILKFITNKIQSLTIKIHNNKIHKCPKCNTKLIINDDVLEKYNDNDIKTYNNIELNKLNEIHNKYISYNSKLTDINNNIKDIKNILNKQKYIEISDDAYEILLNKYNKYKETSNKLNDIKNSKSNFLDDKKILDEYKNKIQILQNTNNTNDNLIINKNINYNEILTNLINIKNIYDNTINSINKLKNYNNELQNKINNIKITDINYNTKINDIQNTINTYNIKINKYNNYIQNNNLYIEYENYINILNKYNNDIENTNYKINNKEKDINNIDLLLKKINQAESLAISEIVNNINYYMNYYLQKFFDNSINVLFTAFKEQKNGIVKPNINLKITYKGNESELEELSGGELDRVILCIFLSLNVINNSELLLLDESLSSIQSDLADDIVDVLKTNINKTIIMVSHQCSSGLFDNIINIKPD
jgi:DNA repair exonuclease SbcCD ATPase subunit